MAAHTPRPWKYRPAGKFTEEVLDNGVPVTVEHEYPDHVVAQWRDSENRLCTGFVCICEAATLPNAANARLIAIAPELLDCLRDVLTAGAKPDMSVKQNRDEFDAAISRAWSAIAKVEGS